jgi:glycosyltransferase involved in cell wall biosynthesis
MPAAPLISIVIATRNAAGTLARCLDSIRAQSFRDFELLVMDGASTDATVELLRASGDIVTLWRSAPDSGIYGAWNKALALARGRWICFLGADDWLWDEGALERLAPHLRAEPPAERVVYSRVRQIDAGGALVAELGEPWERAKAAFRSHRCLPQPGLMHHRSLFERHGVFDERFAIAADYELLLRELKAADALFVPAATVGMQFGGLTTSPQNYYRLLRETREALALHGLAPPRLRWAYWTLCAWLYVKLRALLGDRAARRLADLYRLLSLRKARYSNGRG